MIQWFDDIRVLGQPVCIVLFCFFVFPPRGPKMAATVPNIPSSTIIYKGWKERVNSLQVHLFSSKRKIFPQILQDFPLHLTGQNRVARPHSTAAQTQSLTKGNRILRIVLDQTHHDSSSGAGSVSPQSANPRMEMRFHYPRKKRDWLSVDHGHQRQIPPFAQGKS